MIMNDNFSIILTYPHIHSEDYVYGRVKYSGIC